MYSWPTTYLHYYFESDTESIDLFHGFIGFSDDDSDIDGMTFGGQVIISDQLNGDSVDLFLKPTVNPFLDLPLSQLAFKDVLLQDNQIFVNDFSPEISLIIASAATHIPTTIYDYMDENFFKYICETSGSEYNRIVRTSTAVPLATCECNGNIYYGMPTIEFTLDVD